MMNRNSELSSTTKRLLALETLQGDKKTETTPEERPKETFSWIKKDLERKYSAINLHSIPEKSSSTSIASRKLHFDDASLIRVKELRERSNNETPRAFNPLKESRSLMAIPSTRKSGNSGPSTSSYTRSEFYGLAGSSKKYQNEIPPKNLPVETTSYSRIPLAQNYSRFDPQVSNEAANPLRSSNLSIPKYTRPSETPERTFLARPPPLNQPQPSSRCEDPNRFLIPSNVHPVQITQQNRYEHRTAPYYSTKWTRPVISGSFQASSVNDQTYTVSSNFDVSMGKSDDDLFTTKGSIEFQDNQFTSDYFTTAGKSNTLDSILFSPPPEKKAKLDDLISDISQIGESLLEVPSIEIQKKNNKISTASLFGDASIDSEKIFSQSDVIDDGPVHMDTSDVIDLDSSDEKSYEKIIEAKTKKPVESESSFSSESNSSINSAYFDKLFEKQSKGKNEAKGAIKKVAQPTRFSARKRNTKAATQSVAPKNGSGSKSNVSLPELVIEDVESQGNPPALSEPIIKPAKLSKATTSTSEPIDPKSKEKALEKLNEIIKKLKEERGEPRETVDTYYNSKERTCLFESKRKPKFMSQPANLLNGVPEFENVREYFRQKRQILRERYCYIEIGSKNQPLKEPEEDHNSFDYGDINESLQEIEDSFNNPLSFLTSTPESKIERPVEVKFEPIEIDSNYPIATIDDASIPSPSPRLSQLTHISASLSHGAVDSSYQFALNSIFNITEKNQTAQEDRMNESDRIDFLHSLIREENVLDDSFIPDYANKEIVERRRAAIMGHIEGIIQTLLTTLVDQKPIVLKICKVKDFNDCTMADDILSQKETSIALKTISFTNANSTRTYTIMVFLICEIYKMISKGVSVTRRELYYRDPALMLNQATVNRAVEDVCILLNVLPWEVGVLSTSKGLVAGDLKIYMNDEDIIDCSHVTRSVPQVPTEIGKVTSNADYILVVEKDTVFTRLVQDKIFSKLKTKIILVTGKGYPDINTRVLLKRLEDDLKIPIYIIVDADPHGIEIMCTYKFGSLQMIHNSEQLAVKSIEWLGLYPSDIEPIGVPHMNLTAAELKKVDELLDRPYLTPKLLQELNCFKARKLKAEIEGLYETSTDYFIRDYISTKILGIPQPFIDGLVKAGNQWYKTGKDSYIKSKTQTNN